MPLSNFGCVGVSGIWTVTERPKTTVRAIFSESYDQQLSIYKLYFTNYIFPNFIISVFNDIGNIALSPSWLPNVPHSERFSFGSTAWERAMWTFMKEFSFEVSSLLIDSIHPHVGINFPCCWHHQLFRKFLACINFDRWTNVRLIKWLLLRSESKRCKKKVRLIQESNGWFHNSSPTVAIGGTHKKGDRHHSRWSIISFVGNSRISHF